MRKVIVAVLMMLFWCNVGFAEVIKYNCTSSARSDGDYIYTLDTDNKKIISEFIDKKGKSYRETSTVVSIDNQKVSVLNDTSDSKTWYFNYATDQKIYGSYFKDINLSCMYDKNLVKSATNKSNKVEIASMIDDAKDKCKVIGYREGTDKFADCALKLYSQSVELAAEQNKTVVMQPQSSGSSSMTIYDPVRDSNALIKQGQRMLSGRCTLGIDC